MPFSFTLIFNFIMKTKSIVFLAVFLLSISALPIYNSLFGSSPLLAGSMAKKLKDAYNIDSITSVTGSLGNLVGISVDEKKVFFGRHGWLFLGEDFNHPISKKIAGAEKYSASIQKTLKSMKEWEFLAKATGAKGFYVVVGPDKDSIYTEELPYWYKKSNNSVTKSLVVQGNMYVDTVTLILDEKIKTSFPLYFKTDTHWNELGAYAAFKGLIAKSKSNGDKLLWPADNLEFQSFKAEAGDLSRFQRSGKFLSDNDVKITSSPVTNIPLSIMSYRSGAVLYNGLNKSIESPGEPLLVESPAALNSTKVLWLRDSFGTAMSKLMASTFSETLQVHHGRISPEEIKKIMLSYKPDYVIITVVERDELSKMFSYDPADSNP